MSNEDQNQATSVRLSVLGMRCAGCVSAVEGALQAVPGVSKAEVNFADHTAMVVGEADIEALKKAVKEAGFEAAVMEGLDDLGGREEQEEARYLSLLKKAKVAAYLGVPLMVGAHFGWFPELGTVGGARFWGVIAALTFAVMYYSGEHFYLGAIKSIQLRQYNMDTLIALGTGAASISRPRPSRSPASCPTTPNTPISRRRRLFWPS